MALVYIINKQTSKDPTIMKWVRHYVLSPSYYRNYKYSSRSTFSIADSSVQERLPINGHSTKNCEPRSADNLKGLLQESLTKSSRYSDNRIYHNYEQFSKLYFPNLEVFPASLENLTMFIAHCFEQNYAASTCFQTIIEGFTFGFKWVWRVISHMVCPKIPCMLSKTLKFMRN
jgi:hypothetical protein